MSYKNSFETKEDKNIIFDNAIESVKKKAIYLSKYIEAKNIKQILKCSCTLLSEISCEYNAEQYSTLISIIINELFFLKSFYVNEYKADSIDLYSDYTRLQSISSTLPRLYLMILIGIVICENEHKCNNTKNLLNTLRIQSIIVDLMKFMICIKSPIKGLYTRYFFLKQFKQLLCSIKPIENINDKANNSLSDIIYISLEDNYMLTFVIDMLLNNLKHSCCLWSNISSTKDKDACKQLVGENVFILANIDCIDLKLYSNFILTKLLNLILNMQDISIQNYLIECVIHAFPTEFNLNCVKEIFSAIFTFNKLNSNYNNNNLVLSFIKRVEDLITKHNISEENFDSFNIAIENFVNLEQSIILESISIKSFIKTIDLYYNIIKCYISLRKNKTFKTESSYNFIVKCYNKIYYFIKHFEEIFTKDNNANNQNSKCHFQKDDDKNKLINRLYNLLLLPFINNSEINVIDINCYDNIALVLNYQENKEKINNIAVNYINQICINNGKSKISNIETIEKLVNIANNILINLKLDSKFYNSNYKLDTAIIKSNEIAENSSYKFSILCSNKNYQYEETIICKIPFSIDNSDPNKGIDLLEYFYNKLCSMNIYSVKIISSIIYCFISLILKLGSCNNLNNLKRQKINACANKLTEENLKNLNRLILKCYDKTKEIIKSKFLLLPEMGFMFYIKLLVNIQFIFKNLGYHVEYINDPSLIKLKNDLNNVYEGLIEYIKSEAHKSNNYEELLKEFIILVYYSADILDNNFKLVNSENINQFTYIRFFIKELIDKLTKRIDQTKTLIILIKLEFKYYLENKGLNNLDKMEIENMNEYISKVVEYSEYAVMVNNKNILCMIDTINLFIYLVKYNFKFFKAKHIEKLIKKVKNILITIKDEYTLNEEDIINNLNFLNKNKQINNIETLNKKPKLDNKNNVFLDVKYSNESNSTIEKSNNDNKKDSLEKKLLIIREDKDYYLKLEEYFNNTIICIKNSKDYFPIFKSLDI